MRQPFYNIIPISLLQSALDSHVVFDLGDQSCNHNNSLHRVARFQEKQRVYISLRSVKTTSDIQQRTSRGVRTMFNQSERGYSVRTGCTSRGVRPRQGVRHEVYALGYASCFTRFSRILLTFSACIITP